MEFLKKLLTLTDAHPLIYRLYTDREINLLQFCARARWAACAGRPGRVYCCLLQALFSSQFFTDLPALT